MVALICSLGIISFFPEIVCVCLCAHLKIVFFLLGWLDSNAHRFGEADRHTLYLVLICYLKCFVRRGGFTGGILSL